MNALKLFHGNSNPELARKIAAHLHIPTGKAVVDRFPNGEIRILLAESVRGCDVFIIQSTSPPVNENLMELMLMIDALKRSSAASITAVIPYFGYSKQEKRKSGREPISAKVVADMLSVAGINRIITVDLHAAQIEGFFNIPADNLPTVRFFSDYILKKKLSNFVIVSPDAGRISTARRYGEILGANIAIIDKYRPGYKSAKAMHVIGDVRDKNALIIDDFIDTGGSMVEAIKTVRENGAKDTYICVTHSLLTPPAVERLSSVNVKEIITSDTVAIPREKLLPNMKIASIAPLLAEVIKRIDRRQSVSSLFETNLIR